VVIVTFEAAVKLSRIERDAFSSCSSFSSSITMLGLARAVFWVCGAFECDIPSGFCTILGPEGVLRAVRDRDGANDAQSV
jgi:hypothetical protein